MYCLIPARSGSKRLPMKNQLEIDGKPVLGITIETLKAMNLFEEIGVSTDSETISSIASQYGASVPFLRSRELSGDEIGTLAVIKDWIVRRNIKDFNSLLYCVYPFSIFLKKSLIAQANKVIACRKPDSRDIVVFTAKKSPQPIERSFRLGQDNEPIFSSPALMKSRTQDFSHAYFDAGQFYAANIKTWLETEEVLSNAIAIEIDSLPYIDVDYPQDFDNLKLLYSLYYGGRSS